MVARLVIDAVWRIRWLYAAIGVFLTAVWLLFGMSRDNALPISMPAVSLICAVVLGPMSVMAAMGLRELRHLPVTRRDLWRATWVVATVVSTGLLLSTKALAALLVTMPGVRPGVSAAAILLTAVYDFAWAGSVLLVLPSLGYAVSAAGKRGTLAVSLALAGTLGSVAACFGLPILLGDVLPSELSQFTPVTTSVLIACLVGAFGALVWTPQRGVMAGERPRPPRGGVLQGVATRPRLTDNLTGISRVVIPHLAATIAFPVGACLALASYGVISGSGIWWFVPPIPDVFDSADVGYRGLTYFVLMPCAVGVMLGLWTPWARLLKVLPISVRQINALLLFTPFATWSVLWFVGWFAYSLAYGTPRTLGLEFALGMAALSALAHAGQLRLAGTNAQSWIFAGLGGLLPAFLQVGLRQGTVAHVVFALISAMAFCAAAIVNHRTLTQSTSSSRTYRRPQPPFGLNAGTTR
jgi:hypothetical protein